MTPELATRLSAWIDGVPISTGALQDTSGYVELYKRVFKRDLPPSYVPWRYKARGAPGVFLIVPGNESPRGVWGHDFLAMYGAPGLRAAFAVDLMLDPQMQRTGVTFARLARSAQELVDKHAAAVWYSFPNEKGRAALIDFCGHREVERVPLWSAQTRPYTGSLQAERVARVGPWVGEIEKAFAAAHPDLTWVRRSETYLTWRFLEHPLHTYDMLRIHDDGSLVGYVVTKVFQDTKSGTVTGDILDLLWTRDESDIVHGMLELALDTLRAHGIPTAVGWFRNNTLLDVAARRAGFAPSSSTRSFVVKVLDSDWDKLGDPARWFLTLSDSELY